MSDALIEGVSGAIGAITALVSTYPLLTVSASAITASCLSVYLQTAPLE